MSILNVNKINPVGGGSTVTIAGIASVTNNISVGNSVTAGSFIGPIEGTVTGNVTGNVTGDATGLSGNPSINTTGIVTATAFVSNTPLSHRNVIVNGGCIVAQRGSSSTSSGLGSVDRMKMSVTNTDELAFAQKQTSDGPDGFNKCFEFDVTTAESALAVDELVYMRYSVEGQDLKPFFNGNGSGRNFTLSFYVKAYQTGTYQVSIYKGFNVGRFISATYTVTSSGTWQRVVLNFTGDTGTSGIPGDNTAGFLIDFKLGAGTNYTSGTPVTSWGSFSNAVFATGQSVNVLSSTDNYWRITGIQLELGDVSTPFEHRSFGDELARCQRYYYMHHNTSKTGTEGNYRVLCLGFASGTTEVTGHIFFPVTMRDNPSLDANSGVVGGIGYWRIAGGSLGGDKYIDGAWTISSPTTRSTRIYATPRTSLTAGATGYIDGRNTASYMAFSAEL